MRNIVLGLAATALTFGFSFGTSTPVFAQSADSLSVESFYYQDDLPAWAADHIELLTYLEILVGYPDGTFKSNENLTRAEFAVALTQGLIVLEEGIYDAMYWNNSYIYEELAAQQLELLQALSRLDAIEAEKLVENNNFVALSVIYNAEDSSVDDNAYISLDGKFQIVSISDTFKLSIRPFVNTTGEAGGALTLDTELTDKLTVAAGMGYAGSWSDDSALAGDSNGVTYAQASVDYDLSKDTVITLGAKVPVEGENSGDINFGLGFGLRF